jgi:hypothetical protein
VYDGTTWTDLSCPCAIRTRALGVFDSRIVGYYRDADGQQHGFLLTTPEPTSLALLAVAASVAIRRAGPAGSQHRPC